MELPGFLHRVMAVHEAVAVDFTIPGCPPEPAQIVAIVRRLANGDALPPLGALMGCADQAVCDECPRPKRGVPAPRLLRSCEAIPEPGWCLLEQGFACVGTSTRGGCGALCPVVAMPCTGCYGPMDATADPGAAALAAVAAAIKPGDRGDKDEAALHGCLREALSGLDDPLGSFYRYSLAETVVADRPKEGK